MDYLAFAPLKGLKTRYKRKRHSVKMPAYDNAQRGRQGFHEHRYHAHGFNGQDSLLDEEVHHSWPDKFAEKTL